MVDGQDEPVAEDVDVLAGAVATLPVADEPGLLEFLKLGTEFGQVGQQAGWSGRGVADGVGGVVGQVGAEPVPEVVGCPGPLVAGLVVVECLLVELEDPPGGNLTGVGEGELGGGLGLGRPGRWGSERVVGDLR